MKNLLISGYRSYELNAFSSTDPKVQFIKDALKKALKHYIEEGLEWVLITGQLGIELWAGEVVIELKEEYPQLKLGILFPHEEFGNKWNEKNQQLLHTVVSKADFVESTSHKPYQSPRQLSANQAFMLEHSHGTLLVYDPEYEGKPKYLYQMIQKKQETSTYPLELITFFELQEMVDQQQDSFWEPS